MTIPAKIENSIEKQSNVYRLDQFKKLFGTPMDYESPFREIEQAFVAGARFGYSLRDEEVNELVEIVGYYANAIYDDVNCRFQPNGVIAQRALKKWEESQK